MLPNWDSLVVFLFGLTAVTCLVAILAVIVMVAITVVKALV